MYFLRTLISHALPTACIVCARYQKAMLCDACYAFLEKQSLFYYPSCIRCGIQDDACAIEPHLCGMCLQHPPAFDQTYCFDRYDGVLQNAMHQLKYQRRLAVADAIAFAWNRLAMPFLSNVECDLLLPVPLSTQKLSLRGFNQSWEIAKRIALPPGVQPIANALERHHSDSNQVKHNRQDRQAALRHAFYIQPEMQGKIQNKSILVFDDVMTTGSTLHEIATVLKDNGASFVVNWVVLRTLDPLTRTHSRNP